MTTLLLSVLIVTYRRNKLLKECIDSIFAQSFMPDEIVVVDNASDKATKKLVNSYKGRNVAIRYSQNSKNNISNARNKAMKIAKNTYIAFLDDDCIASRNWIRIGYIILKNDPTCIYYGKSLNGGTFNTIGNYEYKKTESFFSQSRINVKEKKFSFLLDTKNCMFDKKVFTKNEIMFDDDFHRLEDLDISFALAKKNISIRYIDQMWVTHSYRKNIVEGMFHDFQIGYYTAMAWKKYKSGSQRVVIRTLTYPKDIPASYRYFSLLFLYLGTIIYSIKSYYYSLNLNLT